MVASVKEEKLKSSNLGTASDAEAEAISRGLQVTHLLSRTFGV